MTWREGLRLIAGTRKRWTRLPKVDVAIFDTHCGAHLAKVLAGYSTFSIDIRGESVHVPTLLGAAARFLMRRGPASLSILYFSSVIRKLGARVCITNQDANQIFYMVDKAMPAVRFIAVQQGLKDAHDIGLFSKLSGDYFAFGSAYAEKLAAGGGAATMHVAGSLKGNMARLSASKQPRVAYISGLSDHDVSARVFRDVSYAEFVYPPTYAGLREVDEFCSRNAIPLVIASKAKAEVLSADRHPVYQRERAIFGHILGREPELIMGDSYAVAGDSAMVVCDQSALGYELLGLGCKVVFINLIAYFHREPSYRFGWPLELPDQGPFWSNRCVTADIQAMLDRVWRMPSAEWKALIAPYQAQLMGWNPDNTMLLRHIDSCLAPR
jgi:surface carbohydrate biosynthesis protein